MFPVLAAKGIIASQESGLLVEATLLMLIVAVPVLGMLFFFAWRYREGGKGAYRPHWEHSKMDELIWWAIPLEIILVLGAITWSSTHTLDPRKPLVSDVPPLTIQVVALPWKWLFIYPAQHVATVNFVEIPVNTPVDFEITADAPMNSFWIPSLGGQIYAMTGMDNSLNLMASEPGDYAGSSANYSGVGFADMTFVARAAMPADFNAWLASVRAGSTTLDKPAYDALAMPGTTTPRAYASVKDEFFHEILMQFDH